MGERIEQWFALESTSVDGAFGRLNEHQIVAALWGLGRSARGCQSPSGSALTPTAIMMPTKAAPD